MQMFGLSIAAFIVGIFVGVGMFSRYGRALIAYRRRGLSPFFDRRSNHRARTKIESLQAELDEALFSCAYLESIIESVSDVIIVADSNGLIKRFNSLAPQTLGIDSETLLTMQLSDILSHPKLLFGTFLNSMKEGDFPLNIEFNFESQDRGLIPILLSARGLKSGAEESTDDFVFSIKDISALKEAQEKVETQRAVAIHSAKLATLGEMAGGIAHEINNPLSVIVGYANKIQRLKKKDMLDDMAIEEASSTIKKTALRIAKIIRSMRMLARDGSLDPVEKTKIHSIVDDTLELCRERFMSRGVDLKVLLPDQELEFDCRPVQIGQIILNLLNNATDAVKDNDEKWVELSVHHVAGSSHLQIWVTDSGSGIPSAMRDKILQPFFTTKEVGEGTGLGLSISKRLIEGHGGALKIDSSCENTRFVVELPLKDPNDLSVLAFAG